MREIKFRAWDGTRFYWFDDDHRFALEFNKISGWNVVPNTPDYKGNYLAGASADSAESFVLEQFTGLKDKNGREIYEGDIVRAGAADAVPFIRTVEFFAGGFLPFCDTAVVMPAIVCEVIGNIHENPELLK